jgi:hypothetical protein
MTAINALRPAAPTPVIAPTAKAKRQSKTSPTRGCEGAKAVIFEAIFLGNLRSLCNASSATGGRESLQKPDTIATVAIVHADRTIAELSAVLAQRSGSFKPFSAAYLKLYCGADGLDVTRALVYG